jgi:hypothetical protein
MLFNSFQNCKGFVMQPYIILPTDIDKMVKRAKTTNNITIILRILAIVRDKQTEGTSVQDLVGFLGEGYRTAFKLTPYRYDAPVYSAVNRSTTSYLSRMLASGCPACVTFPLKRILHEGVVQVMPRSLSCLEEWALSWVIELPDMLDGKGNNTGPQHLVVLNPILQRFPVRMDANVTIYFGISSSSSITNAARLDVVIVRIAVEIELEKSPRDDIRRTLPWRLPIRNLRKGVRRGWIVASERTDKGC